MNGRIPNPRCANHISGGATCQTARRLFNTWAESNSINVSDDGGAKLTQSGTTQTLDSSSKQGNSVGELSDPVILIDSEHTAGTGSGILSSDRMPERVEVVINKFRFSHDLSLCDYCAHTQRLAAAS